MSKKIIPISLRISEDDAAFIEALSIEGADTPSEKVRALIQEARHRQEYSGLYELAAHMFHDEKEEIKAFEFKSGMHSELMFIYIDWLIESFAHFGASASHLRGENQEREFEKLEHEISIRIYRLFDSVLRMTITDRAPCYDPSLLRQSHKRINQLTDLVSAQLKKN